MNQTQDASPRKGSLSRLAAVAALVALAGCAVGDDQPGGMFYVRGGLSTTTFEIDGSNDVDTDAYNAEIAVEGQGSVVGGGVRLSGFQSDDELGGVGADTSVTSTGLFAHLTFRPAAGRFRMPIRVGPELRGHNFDTPGSIADVDSYALGLSVELEPEIDLFRGERSALSLYGRGHAGLGIGAVDTSIDTYGTETTLLGAEAGVRLQLAKFLLAAGYVWQSTIYDQTDPENNLTVPETTYTNDGIFLSVGVRF